MTKNRVILLRERFSNGLNRRGRIVGSRQTSTLPTMRRGFFTALLCLLLLGMQQEAQWHALGHFGDWLRGPHEQSLLLPQADEVCAICALFAGGANGAPTTATATAAIATDYEAPRDHVIAVTALTSPSPYQSRAPPSFL